MHGIILFSHDPNLSLALKDYLINMVGEENQYVKLFAAGGLLNKSLGTNYEDLIDIFKANPNVENWFIFSDIGSAIMSAEVAQMQAPNLRIEVVKNAFFESAFATYVIARAGANYESLYETSKEEIKK